MLPKVHYSFSITELEGLELAITKNTPQFGEHRWFNLDAGPYILSMDIDGYR